MKTGDKVLLYNYPNFLLLVTFVIFPNFNLPCSLKMCIKCVCYIIKNAVKPLAIAFLQ